jgi:hypothetical protein
MTEDVVLRHLTVEYSPGEPQHEMTTRSTFQLCTPFRIALPAQITRAPPRLAPVLVTC